MKIWLPTIKANSGADVFTMRLAEALQRTGHEPVVEWYDHRYEIMPWRLKKMPVPLGTDLIHAGSWQGFAFKRAGIPLVITEHNYLKHPEFIEYRGVAQKIYHDFLISHYLKLSYDAADVLVSVSEHNAKAMRNDFSKQIEVIHNWVDTDEFYPKSEQLTNTGNRPFRLVYVGNPSRWKGSDLVTDFAEKLPLEIELLCLGGLRTKLKTIGQNIRQLPRHEPHEMPDLYRNVDAVVVLSRYESFGYVALEAMASGVPVIGFDVSGTAEVCKGADCAVLVPDGDIDALALAAVRLSKSNSLCQRLGANGRHAAINRFSGSKQIQYYLDLYARVCNQ